MNGFSEQFVLGGAPQQGKKESRELPLLAKKCNYRYEILKLFLSTPPFHEKITMYTHGILKRALEPLPAVYSKIRNL